MTKENNLPSLILTTSLYLTFYLHFPFMASLDSNFNLTLNISQCRTAFTTPIMCCSLNDICVKKEAFFIWNVHICWMYLLTRSGCSIRFAYLSACWWLQYSCCSFWSSISSFPCKAKFCVFLFTPPRDGRQHLVLWRDNQVTNCRASDFCQWGCLMRSVEEGNPVLLGWFFSTEVKKDKKATEEETGNVLYILVLWQYACWHFMRFLDDLLGNNIYRSPWADGCSCEK